MWGILKRCQSTIPYNYFRDVIGESSGLSSIVPSSLGAVGASTVNAFENKKYLFFCHWHSNFIQTLAHSSQNGNVPHESADLELEHDLHNASTLLASEKRNGVRKKVSSSDFFMVRWFGYLGQCEAFLM